MTLIALLRPDFELQNAYYGFVLRMTDMGFLIPTFLLNSALPILSERNSSGEETASLLSKTFLTILIIGSALFVFSFLWPRPLVELLTTEAYLSTALRPGSDTALKILALPMFLNGIILFGFYVLLTANKWRELVSALSIGVAISFGGNLFLIPKYGFTGAAAVSAGVHLVLAAILFIQARKTMPFSLPNNIIFRWAAFSLAMAMMLIIIGPYLTNEITTIIGLAGAGIIMAVLAEVAGLRRFVMR